jgi:hypothetical protein
MKKITTILLILFTLTAMNIFADSGHVITDKAELKGISITTRNIDGKSNEKVVLFTLTLKNTSNEPRVYKALAIIDNKSAGEGIIPSDEQGLKRVKPGEEVTGQVAVMYNTFPTNFVLMVDVEK